MACIDAASAPEPDRIVMGSASALAGIALSKTVTTAGTTNLIERGRRSTNNIQPPLLSRRFAAVQFVSTTPKCAPSHSNQLRWLLRGCEMAIPMLQKQLPNFAWEEAG